MKIFIQIVLWIAHILLYVFRDFTFVNINSQIGHLQAVEGSRFELVFIDKSSLIIVHKIANTIFC